MKSSKTNKFDPKKQIEKICKFIRKYYKDNNLKGVVLGISGGKDSAVVAGLFVKALGKENVFGLTLPCHSLPQDAKDAKKVADYFGFELRNIDLTSTYDSFIKEASKLNIMDLSNSTDEFNVNLKPRLRMSTCYYMAALLSKERKGTYIVAGTSNACELYVGYFTKGGDSVHDISVLANLTVDEVIAIGEELGVPDEVIHKAPSDGLSKKTDEEKMGIKYKDVAAILRKKKVPAKEKKKIENLHKRSAHKFKIPTYKG